MPYNSKTITFIIITAMLENILAAIAFMETLLTAKELALTMVVLSTLKAGIATWIRFNTTTPVKGKAFI